jgi:hypothetical protein
MKFAADRMLGKLAKWLRLLGFDTLYSNRFTDAEFLGLAEEGRVLLTRNTALLKGADPQKVLFIRDDDPKIQLREVITSLGLEPDPESFFSRCTLCNGVLGTIDPMDVSGQVPEYVWTSHDKFCKCQDCGKIYWPGSHLKASLREIDEILNG